MRFLLMSCSCALIHIVIVKNAILLFFCCPLQSWHHCTATMSDSEDDDIIFETDVFDIVFFNEGQVMPD